MHKNWCKLENNIFLNIIKIIIVMMLLLMMIMMVMVMMMSMIIFKHLVIKVRLKKKMKVIMRIRRSSIRN